MAVENQTITVDRGEDAVVPFDGADACTGWAIAFGVSRVRGEALYSGYPLTVGAGITITSGPAGQFAVTIPAALTAARAAGRYAWDVWRTDAGTAYPLASGTLVVREPVRRP